MMSVGILSDAWAEAADRGEPAEAVWSGRDWATWATAQGFVWATFATIGGVAAVVLGMVL